MPSPPNFEDFTEINFITNMWMLGCDPPFLLVVELAKEPTKELAMMLFVPDLFDISQAIVAPQKGRKRTPARRGRKRRRGFSFPDPSDIIGGKLRSFGTPLEVFKMGFRRFAFVVFNIYEGVRFMAALIEGLEDIVFARMLSAAMMNKSDCMNVPKFMSRRTTPTGMGAGGVSPWPIDLPEVEFSTGFALTDQQCTGFGTPYSLGLTLHAYNEMNNFTTRGAVRLHNITTGAIAESGMQEIAPLSHANFSISIDCAAGDTVQWQWILGVGRTICLDATALGFADPFF